MSKEIINVAVRFTRHAFTPEQEAEFLSRANTDNETPLDIMGDLASRNITSEDEAIAVVEEFLTRCKDHAKARGGRLGALSIYGVLASPVRWAFEQLCHVRGEFGVSVWVHEAFNVNRAPEGQKPQFTFNGWLLTQVFNE